MQSGGEVSSTSSIATKIKQKPEKDSISSIEIKSIAAKARK